MEKVSKHLKDNALRAVPFDKGAGLCIMKETDYSMSLQKVLFCRQFTELQTEGAKPLTIKIEEDLNQELLSLLRAGKISERFYNEPVQQVHRQDCMVSPKSTKRTLR